jgi:O-antigen/teichoic acid export membrane protein
MSFSEKSASVFKRDIFIKFWTILTSVIIARVLGSATMGIWYILLMVPNYADPLGRLKLDVASVYFICRRKYRVGEVYFNLIAVSLLSSAIIIALFFWQREFIFLKLLKGVLIRNDLVYFMFFCIPLNFITINYSYLFLAKEDVKSYNKLAVIGPFISSILSIFCLVVLKWGVFSLVICQVISGLIGVLYGAFKLGKTEKMIPELNLVMLKDFLKFGSKLYLGGVVNYFQVYVAGIIVAVYLLPASVTFFKMGQEKALMLSMIPSAMGTILYPYVARNDMRADDISAKACRMSVLLLSIFSVIGAVLIKPAVFILYGREFLPQVGPFLIILPGVIFLSCGNVLMQHFTGKGNPELVLKISFFIMLIQVGLCIFLIPHFGILGASIATSLTYVMTGLIIMAVFIRNTKLVISDVIFPKKADIRSLLGFLKSQVLKYKPKNGMVV